MPILALIQSRVSSSRHDNLERTCQKITDAAARGANIIVTQELFLCPYFCQTENATNFSYAEDLHEHSELMRTFSDLARDHGVVLVLSLFEKRAQGIYHNSAVVIDADGRYAGKYRKMHIPDDPQYYEKFYFTPGDLGYPVFQTRFGTLGVLICWDQWYPEAARLIALAGAQIILYPTAIGALSGDTNAEHQAWETIQRSHAIANGCYVAAVNRTGFEAAPDGQGGINFWGRSFVSGPRGEIIARLDADSDDILCADIELTAVDKTRIEWPFFRDRRIESYGDIQKRFCD